MGKKTKLFIDIDNYYIRQGGPSKKLFISKIAELEKKYDFNNKKIKLYLFGNTYTSNFVKKHNIKLPKDTIFHVTENKADSADHKLLQILYKEYIPRNTHYVMTDDKILLKLVYHTMYLEYGNQTEKNIEYFNTKYQKHKNNFSILRDKEYNKFAMNYLLFHYRYISESQEVRSNSRKFADKHSTRFADFLKEMKILETK